MIQVAVIGTGAISGSHIQGYQEFPEQCRIVALVDKDVKKARKRAAEYGLEDMDIYEDADQLMASNMPDLVSICLPPALHCEIAVKLLEQGISVLCEKPLAPTLEECDRMLAAAKKGKAMLSCVAQNRFKPDVVKAKRLVDSGILGQRLFAQASSLWWRGKNYYNLAWRGRWETEGGGCTLIHGIHHIDLFLWMMGEVKNVTALAANEAHDNSEVEDISLSLVHFRNGAVGTVVSSLLHHGEEQTLILDGENGSVELPLKLAASRQLENGFPETNVPVLEKMKEFCEQIQIGYTGHTAQIKDVLDALEKNGEPSVSGEDGRRAIEFITATYQSAFTGKTVEFPLSPKDLFYTKEGILKHAVRFYEKTVSIDGFANDAIQVGGTL